MEVLSEQSLQLKLQCVGFPPECLGFKSPRCWWGPREEIFWHLNSKRITTDWPRKLQSYQQCIVGFFPQPLPGIGAGGYPRSTCFNQPILIRHPRVQAWSSIVFTALTSLRTSRFTSPASRPLVRTRTHELKRRG